MTNEKLWWEKEFEKEMECKWNFGNPIDYFLDKENREQVVSLISKVDQRAREEEHQFFKNILDGIDSADEQMQNKGGGTKAIRFALKSRLLK